MAFGILLAFNMVFRWTWFCCFLSFYISPRKLQHIRVIKVAPKWANYTFLKDFKFLSTIVHGG